MKDKERNTCTCPFCNTEIELNEKPFCEHCQIDIKVNYCKDCGKPFPSEYTVCPACGQS